MTTAIKIERLCKTYSKRFGRGAVKAVDDVSLEVEQGEAFGFIGPNGAGKSSTIRIMMGLARKTSGEGFLHGMPMERPEARRGIGYVPESPYLYEYLTPTEILSMSLALHRVPIGDQSAHISTWLDRLGLSAVSRTAIRSFSKGMVQRVAIAQALAIKPKLLVLDEPLSGLDPIGRIEVVQLLSDYKRDGGTLFFTSHVLHDVERLADRFGLIHNGHLRSVRSPAELVQEMDTLVVRTMGSEPVAGMVADGSGRWSGEWPRSEIWERLDVLRRAGHVVLEVKPNLSLEAAFLKAVGRQVDVK